MSDPGDFDYDQRLDIAWDDGTSQAGITFTSEAGGFNVAGVASIMEHFNEIATVTIAPLGEQHAVRVAGPNTLTFEPTANQ